MRRDACCMSRGPPSPDGQPPNRQINRVSENFKLSDKALVVSCRSRISRPEDAKALQSIFKGDNHGLENVSAPKLRAAGPSKLRKRFSRDSTLTNQRSRLLVVGNSEEEVARRDELKRIRNKRIQEELGDLGVYDDDAVPLCSSPLRPALKSAIDTSNEDSHDEPIIDIINSYSGHSFESDNKHSRRISREGINKLYRSNTVQGSTEAPLPPILRPKTMPSIDDAATRRTSWRLSFTSDQRASCLRALNQSNSRDQSNDYAADRNVPGADSLPTSDDQKKWQSSKVGRLPVEPVASGHLQHLDTASCWKNDSINPLDFDRINGSIERPVTGIPLHEMQISRRLASRGTFVQPASQQSSKYLDSSVDDREHVTPKEDFQEINIRRSRYFRSLSGPDPGDSKIPATSSQVIRDGTSLPHESDCEDGFRPTHESMRSSSRPALTLWQGSYTMANSVQGENDRAQRRINRSSSSRTSKMIPQSPSSITSYYINMKDSQQDLDFSLIGSSKETNHCQPTTPITSRFSESFNEASSTSSAKSSTLSAMRLSRVGRLRTGSQYDHQGLPMNTEMAKTPKVQHGDEIDGPRKNGLRSIATLDNVRSPETSDEDTRTKRRGKYKTWSGHEQRHLADMMALRQSTVDFTKEVELMERVERERALRAADEALASSAG